MDAEGAFTDTSRSSSMDEEDPMGIPAGTPSDGWRSSGSNWLSVERSAHYFDILITENIDVNTKLNCKCKWLEEDNQNTQIGMAEGDLKLQDSSLLVCFLIPHLKRLLSMLLSGWIVTQRHKTLWRSIMCKFGYQGRVLGKGTIIEVQLEINFLLTCKILLKFTENNNKSNSVFW